MPRREKPKIDPAVLRCVSSGYWPGVNLVQALQLSEQLKLPTIRKIAVRLLKSPVASTRSSAEEILECLDGVCGATK